MMLKWEGPNCDFRVKGMKTWSWVCEIKKGKDVCWWKPRRYACVFETESRKASELAKFKKKNGYPPRKTFAFCHYCVLDQSRGAPKTCWRLFPNDWFHQRRTFLIAARRHGVTFPLGKNKTKLLQQTLRCRERWVTWRFFPQIVHSPTSCKTSDSLSKIDGFWMFWHLLFRTKTPKGESWSAWWKIH